MPGVAPEPILDVVRGLSTVRSLKCQCQTPVSCTWRYWVLRNEAAVGCRARFTARLPT